MYTKNTVYTSITHHNFNTVWMTSKYLAPTAPGEMTWTLPLH